LAVLVGRFFGFHAKEVGSLSAMLPPLVGFSWSTREVLATIPSAMGLAFVSAVNILITSRVVEHFRGRHQRMKSSAADAELGAYGIANIFAGMIGAPPSVGIPARSLASVRCGATTRLSNLAHAAFLLGMVALGGDVIARVPMAALAAVTAWVGFGLLEWSTWRRLPRMRRVDAAAFLATAAGVLTMNAVAAVALGCSLYGLHKLWLLRPRRQIPERGFASRGFGALPSVPGPAPVISESSASPIDPGGPNQD